MAHDHPHDEDGQSPPPDVALRVKALELLLVEKGLVDPAALDEIIETYAHRVGPRNGARVVARAWVDKAYRERLLTDATKAIAELGYGGRQGEHMVAVENTAKVHNLIVCTLCSCYPWTVLGLPPTWYKSSAYRSRAVIDPRGVLREFGLEPVRTWRFACGIPRQKYAISSYPSGRQGRSAWTRRLSPILLRAIP